MRGTEALTRSYGSNRHPWFGNFMFLISCIALSLFLAWARQSSESVWPSATLHASHNSYFLQLFEPIGNPPDFRGLQK